MKILKPFAWQGINLNIPENWDLGAASGDYNEGYFRLDDPVDIRLEVRWRREKTGIDLDSILKKYEDSLQAVQKKKKLSFSKIQVPQNFTKTYLRDKETRRFAWKSENIELFNLISQCNRCHTVLMLQMRTDKEDSEIIPDIIKSIEDHSLSDLIRWAVYDFKFSVPDKFKLDKTSLKSGYLEFNFFCKRETLKYRRWGVAEMLLRNRSLQDWASEVVPPVFRRKLQAAAKTGSGPDECINVNLRQFSWAASFIKHCRSTNKIYSLDYKGKKDETLFNKLADQIICH